MSDKYALDGTEDIQHNAYDAHEQVVRASNPENYQEYPKAVAHRDNPYGYGKEPVVVNSKEEEDAFNAAQEKK